MSEINIKVNPDVLKSQAEAVTSLIGEMENSWSDVLSVVSRSKSYWEGDASDLHVSFCEKIREPVENAIRRLKEQPKDLLQMAGIYEESEKSAEESAESLPTSIF